MSELVDRSFYCLNSYIVALVYSLAREETIFESYLECIALHVSELW